MLNIPIFGNTGNENNAYKPFPRKQRGDGAKMTANTGGRKFVPVLKDVMEDIVDGKLDLEWFPFVKGTREITRSAGRG